MLYYKATAGCGVGMFVGLRTRAICRRGAAPRRRHPRARQRARPRLEDAREATMVHAGRHARVQPVGGVRGHRDRTRARWLVELLPRLQAVGAWHAACTGTHGVVLYALNTRVFVSHVQTVLYARIAAHLTPNENLAAHKNCSENYCPPWTVHGAWTVRRPVLLCEPAQRATELARRRGFGLQGHRG